DRCPAYEQALKGQPSFVCTDTSDLEAVAKEREEVAQLVRLLGSRKSELERVLRAALKDVDELVFNGVRYAQFKTTKKSYPLDNTLRILGEATHLDRDALIQRVVSVDNKALDDWLSQLSSSLGPSNVAMLKLRLDNIAHKTHAPRFWAKKVA
ncbi:MAG: PD-(D/E)XK nuclease family protein, partial [Myxococcota bacterium]